MFLGIVVLLNWGYPILLHVLGILVPSRLTSPASPYTPDITIIIPSYNEVMSIEQKIVNLKSLNYSGTIQYIFIDSGSTDGTQDILTTYKDKFDIILQSERKGKTNALNQAFKKSKGELVVLTDANSWLKPNSIINLISVFSNPQIGGAVGNLYFPKFSASESLISDYFRLFRNNIRALESKIDSVSFFSGELCAFRRHLIASIPENTISDDLDILLQIRKQNFLAVYVQNAFVIERRPPKLREFMRQTSRTMQGTIQGIMSHKSMLFNRQYSWFGMLILPAYLLRVLLLPVLLLITEFMFILLLSTEYHLLLAIIFINPFITLLLAVTAVILMYFFRQFIKLLLFLFIVQLAMLAGIYHYLRKHENYIWTKIESSRSQPVNNTPESW